MLVLLLLLHRHLPQPRACCFLKLQQRCYNALCCVVAIDRSQ